MKITRIVATPEGESKFAEVDISLLSHQHGAISRRISNGFVSPNVSFVEVTEGADSGMHHATGRYIVSVMSGVFEVELSTGEIRQWRSGEAFFIDDTEGRHITRIVEGPFRSVTITVPADFVVDKWEQES